MKLPPWTERRNITFQIKIPKATWTKKQNPITNYALYYAREWLLSFHYFINHNSPRISHGLLPLTRPHWAPPCCSPWIHTENKPFIPHYNSNMSMIWFSFFLTTKMLQLIKLSPNCQRPTNKGANFNE